MELTGQRRLPTAAGFAHRTTLSPHTQSASTAAGCGPSSQSRPRSLCSPQPPSADGAPRRASPASSGSRSAGLPSPAAGNSPGAGPALLRQHSAPAGSQCRSSAARLARLHSSGAPPSGPFKRPVKQRLSSFGRGPRVPPGTREGEFRPTQVAPPRAGEAGREFRPAPPAVGGGATGISEKTKQRASEQRAAYGYQNNSRASGKRNDRSVGVSYQAEVIQRRHCADGLYHESDKVRDNSTKMKSATEIKASSYMMKKPTERSQGDSMRPRKEHPSSAENYSRNSTNKRNANDERGSQSVQRREPRISGSTDKVSFLHGKTLQPGEDENRNQPYTKWPMHGEGRQRNQFTYHSESDRSALRQSVKRGNLSFPEERALKKPRCCEPSWNSPDQSASCQIANVAPKTFPETNRHSTTKGWNENKNSYASHRGSYSSDRRSDHRHREEVKLKHRMGSMPQTQRAARPSHGAADQSRSFTPPLAGERAKRRPPLLPTPPSRLYSGGSPAVTTTTCLGETPPPVTPPVTATGVTHHWATGMPLLPQLLEPLSPMSPLSVASPPSPALSLSAASPRSPPAPSSPPVRRPLSPGRELPSPPASPGPPTRCASDRIRPAASRRRPASRLPDSDSDSDSDSGDGRVAGGTRPSRRTAAGRPESREETDLARFHSTHTDGRRIDDIDRGRPCRPRDRCAARLSGLPPTAGPPPDRDAPPAERRPPRGGPTGNGDRFDPEHRCAGQYREQCGANERVDLLPSGPRRKEHRDEVVTCSGSARTGERPDGQRLESAAASRALRQQSAGGAHDPPAATCCDWDEQAGTDCSADCAEYLTSAGSQASPAAAERDLSIFTSEYLSELLQLQRRIMTSRDSAEMTRVLALLWQTGQVRDTALYYDFDLCALDQGVVRQLQKCLS